VKARRRSSGGVDRTASRSESAARVERRQVGETRVDRHFSQSPIRRLFAAGKLSRDFRHQGTAPRNFYNSPQLTDHSAYTTYVCSALVTYCVTACVVFVSSPSLGLYFIFLLSLLCVCGFVCV